MSTSPIRQIRPRTLRRQQQRAARAMPVRLQTSRRQTLLLSTALALGTVFLYGAVATHDFINYDDKDYVTDNSHVIAGLSWSMIRWSLTATEQANWHPLTWLSHALDCQFFGLNAGYHHIANLVFHVLNTVLLFLFLGKVTRSRLRSFLVAALFAWHPLNVQSVAWVAERKNLLSTLFLLLTFGAYVWYVRKPQWKRLAAVAAAFALALAAKPMVVSAPFLLLLLDYWPLRRIAGWTDPVPELSIPARAPWQLVVEKLPLFALSVASCAITLWAQRAGGALRSLQTFSLETRLANALHSYAVYIFKAFLPFGLAVYYPLTANSISYWKSALALIFLAAISVAAWRQRKIRPYFIVGWLWFLGTLIPVIGIVQVGDQAMADRYAYLPLIGLFVVIVWGAHDFLLSQRATMATRCAITICALGALSVLTIEQVGYWRDSETIWTRALAVTHGDLQVEKQLANALVVMGDGDKALPHLEHIAQIEPQDTTIHVNLGACYAAQGRSQEAAQEFERVVELTEHKNLTADDRKFRTSALLNLGFAYTRTGDYSRALADFTAADHFDPQMTSNVAQELQHTVSESPSQAGYIKLALLLRAQGNVKQAVSVLQDAIANSPDDLTSRILSDLLHH